MEDHNKDIDFIAKHYRNNLFNADSALHRIKPVRGFRWTLAKTVAASALILVVSATAAIIIHNEYFVTEPEISEQNQTVAASPETIVRVIDFEDTPLPVVVERIKEVYGVEITGLPANAADYKLSLRYEGSAIDLVYTINDILETDIKINSSAE